VGVVEHSLVLYADEVMRAAQLAAILEVSAWPKPGNVHRTSDYPTKRYEHFLAGSIALGPAVREAAVMGCAAGLQQLPLSEVGVGRLIKKAVVDVKSWHKGGNTHLGVALLFIPLAASAGLTYTQFGSITPERLREGAVKVMEATTDVDAAEVYEAIVIAQPSGLGTVEGAAAPDVGDPTFREVLASRRLTLLEVMRAAESWDNVAEELARGFNLTFNVALPELLSTYKEVRDVNKATVQAFLRVLASKPDTFIARNVGLSLTSRMPDAVRAGMDKAREVSRRAEEVLRLGGALSEEGMRELVKMDEELKKAGGALNPGSTADIVAAALFVAILSGLRP